MDPDKLGLAILQQPELMGDDGSALLGERGELPVVA
jgi:hypothetical protein